MKMQKYGELIENAKRHRDMDMLLSGTYGKVKNESFRGCSVGCFAYDILGDSKQVRGSEKHKIVSDYYGYPEWLVHLQDVVFENLPSNKRNDWHVDLAEGIARNPDRDWKRTFHKVHLGILKIAYRTAGENKHVVQDVIDLHKREASAARSATWSAARSATWSAARSAAWLAAGSTRSAAWSTRSATWSARSATWSARSAARSAESAESAAESAESAAESAQSAVYEDIRNVVLSALREVTV